MLSEIETYLEEVVKAELILQQHKATGQLIDSIDVTDKKVNGTIIIEGSMLFYGKYVDIGRKRNVTRVPVQALIEWVRLKGIATGEDAKNVAFAIREKIFQEGIPTRGSRQIHSPRLNFIGYALEKAEPKLIQLITEMDRGLTVSQVNNIVRNTNKKL